MKKHIPHVFVLASLPAVLFLVSCSNTPPAGPLPAEGSSASTFVQGVPGGQQIDTITVKATVTDIDKKKRLVTLEAANGRKFPVELGPEAVNFDQIAVGDEVVAIVTRSIVAAMGTATSGGDDGAVVAAAGAPKGSLPGAVAAGIMQLTATVEGVNLKKHTATLKFDDGRTETVNVRPDVDLSRHRVGEKVVFTITGTVTIEVLKH